MYGVVVDKRLDDDDEQEIYPEILRGAEMTIYPYLHKFQWGQKISSFDP